MSRELVKGAKRTSYDADTRRMAFIMPDHAAAASWRAKTILFWGKRLQLLCPATMKRDDITAPYLPATSAGRHQVQYQVRVLVNGVEASTVQAILAYRVPCAVTFVSRGCSYGLDVYGYNFFVATFDTVSYPEQLKLVTNIATSGTEIFLHHFGNAFLFNLVIAISLECQVRRAQRRLSSTESSRVHRYAHCSSSRQWIGFQPLGRGWSSAACLWIGG